MKSFMIMATIILIVSLSLMQIKKQGWRIEEFIVKIKLHFLVINLVFLKNIG